MKKFFQMLVVMMLVAVVNTGCMTHYANFSTYSSGYSPTADGGVVSYSKSESYSYNSGYTEYYYVNNSNYGSGRYYQPLPPPTTTYYIVPSPLPAWKNIPNPIQKDRDDHHHNDDGGNRYRANDGGNHHRR